MIWTNKLTEGLDLTSKN